MINLGPNCSKNKGKARKSYLRATGTPIGRFLSSCAWAVKGYMYIANTKITTRLASTKNKQQQYS
eukprot:2231365-Ditylum_brightwellii.AAC.1